MLEGEFLRDGDGGVLSFERDMAQSIERVWAALTIPERVANWCGNRAEIDLRVGGVFRILWPEGMGVMEGVITVLEPPRVIEYSWVEASVAVPASRVRWTLTPRGSACRLRLEHIFTNVDTKSATEFAGGWEDIIASLEAGADSLSKPMDMEAYKVKQAGYAAKFVP